RTKLFFRPTHGLCRPLGRLLIHIIQHRHFYEKVNVAKRKMSIERLRELARYEHRCARTIRKIDGNEDGLAIEHRMHRENASLGSRMSVRNAASKRNCCAFCCNFPTPRATPRIHVMLDV